MKDVTLSCRRLGFLQEETPAVDFLPDHLFLLCLFSTDTLEHTYTITIIERQKNDDSWVYNGYFLALGRLVMSNQRFV